MTYTAEQLRRDAIAIERMHGETLTVEWRGHQASQLRAHAAALEENARLKAERDTSVAVTERIKVALRIRGTGSYVEWAAYCRDALEKLELAEAELATLRKQLAERDAEIVALKGRLHEIAEEWAGAECWEPVTAQEGYAIGLCKRMYRLAAYPKE